MTGDHNGIVDSHVDVYLVAPEKPQKSLDSGLS